MNFAEILLNQVTTLPIKPSSHKSFRKQLSEVLEQFMEIVKSSAEFSKIKQSSESITELSQNDLQVLIDGIITTLDRYFEGNPAEAYQTLENTLKISKIGEILWKDGVLPLGTDVFRIRNKSGNYPLNKCDLFHVPFHQRGLVQTQRFSIPGLPSLYLANCIYVAWEEMLRPDINSIQAVRMRNTKLLRFLDLTTSDYNLCNLSAFCNLNQKTFVIKFLLGQ
jgi:hypothetical protein